MLNTGRERWSKSNIGTEVIAALYCGAIKLWEAISKYWRRKEAWRGKDVW